MYKRLTTKIYHHRSNFIWRRKDSNRTYQSALTLEMDKFQQTWLDAIGISLEYDLRVGAMIMLRGGEKVFIFPIVISIYKINNIFFS